MTSNDVVRDHMPAAHIQPTRCLIVFVTADHEVILYGLGGERDHKMRVCLDPDDHQTIRVTTPEDPTAEALITIGPRDIHVTVTGGEWVQTKDTFAVPEVSLTWSHSHLITVETVTPMAAPETP